MPVGVQIWDASGRLILDTPTQTTRIHQSRVIPWGTPNGSVSIPSLAQGKPFVLTFCHSQKAYNRPKVTVSGTTLSWEGNGQTEQASILVGTR